jgi:hypothetical protein
LLKPSDDLKNEHQRLLVDKLFSHGKTAKEETGVLKTVHISDLKNTFYKDLPKITEAVYVSVTQKGFFEKNPQSAGVRYYVIGVLLMIVGGIVAGSMGFYAFVGLGGSGLIVLIFGFFMGKKSKKGVLTKEHIEGLKLYLNVAEKDRIDFHNAPEKSPEVFEKFLPYAMVLGVEQAWAKQFEGIYNTPPSW